MKSLSKIAAFGLVMVTLAAQPAQLLAQTTNKSAGKSAPAEKKEPGKQTAGPFRGNLAALDKSAKSISVGKRTFYITSETRILKAGKPATLEDGVVGEEVSGGFKTGENGKLVATKITFGPKTIGKTVEKKNEK
jgi:hypothetical protein